MPKSIGTSVNSPSLFQIITPFLFPCLLVGPSFGSSLYMLFKGTEMPWMEENMLKLAVMESISGFKYLSHFEGLQFHVWNSLCVALSQDSSGKWRFRLGSRTTENGIILIFTVTKRGPSPRNTLPRTNIAPENGSSQEENSIPTVHFQVQTVGFRGCTTFKIYECAIRGFQPVPPFHLLEWVVPEDGMTVRKGRKSRWETKKVE